MNQKMNYQGRYWQNWDRGDAASRIDEYWLSSESDWRALLGNDVEKVFRQREELLEVGCGSGLIYQQLVANGIVNNHTYKGGDISQRMLDIGRARFPEADFSQLDIFNLPRTDGSAPNVICIHVLQHLPHYKDAMRELIRITGKKLYVVSWFKTGLEDELVFSAPSERWDGQAFQNNCYSLPCFIDFALSTGRPVHDLRLHHFGGPNYSICLGFEEEHQDRRPSGFAKEMARKAKRLLFAGG